MDFKDSILAFADRVLKLKDKITTEEATKNAFVMPFLKALGYDVFNPEEVLPEFTADVGMKKGEKVDYAIMQDGKPIIIIECKHWSEDLSTHVSQLVRYFGVTDIKFAILTNGVRYQFFSDLEETNKMDEKPFLDFDITKLSEVVLPELKKFHKSYFNIDEIITTASELKYSNEVKRVLREELKKPSPEFVRFFIKQLYPGKATEKVIEFFTEIIMKSGNHLIAELVNEKIKAALENEQESKDKGVTEEEKVEQKEDKKSQIKTTEEELEGYAIVKAILRQKGVEPQRVCHKDTASYFGIMFDDNTRKPICRLWLNAKKKYIGLFDAKKNENKILIKTVDDIYQHADALFATVQRYEDK
jgi:hypothetical protein